MTLNLKKGDKINLSKENRGLGKVIVGLGWDENSIGTNSFNIVGLLKKALNFFTGADDADDDFDCDAVAIMLRDGYFKSKRDLVYYNNLRHSSGSVRHMGDNLTGNSSEESGDSEQISINLKSVPAQYDKIILAVGIYRAIPRHQHFGMIKNAYIRIVDESTRREICRYNLTDNYPDMTHVIFGELYKDKRREWQFQALGDSTRDENVAQLASRYE